MYLHMKKVIYVLNNKEICLPFILSTWEFLKPSYFLSDTSVFVIHGEPLDLGLC